MPQIAQIAATYASQIFWLLIVFGLIYFVIGKGMMPKIEATVEARDRKIADDLAAAQAAHAKADELEAAHRVKMEEARAAVLAATTAAKQASAKESEKSVKAADAVLADKAAAAEASLNAAKTEALTHVEAVAAEATQELVAKVAGLTVDEGTARGAVNAVLAA
jgi:F-type H+-transporting ATPase subunit b